MESDIFASRALIFAAIALFSSVLRILLVFLGLQSLQTINRFSLSSTRTNLRVLKSGAILSKMHCAATKIAFESFFRGCCSALAGLALGHVGVVALCLGRVLLRDRVSCYLPYETSRYLRRDTNTNELGRDQEQFQVLYYNYYWPSMVEESTNAEGLFMWTTGKNWFRSFVVFVDVVGLVQDLLLEWLR